MTVSNEAGQVYSVRVPSQGTTSVCHTSRVVLRPQLEEPSCEAPTLVPLTDPPTARGVALAQRLLEGCASVRTAGAAAARPMRRLAPGRVGMVASLLAAGMSHRPGSTAPGGELVEEAGEVDDIEDGGAGGV